MQHAFYGKRSDSKTLYGHVLRAVAPQRGEPGSRWPLVQVYKQSLRPAAHRAQPHSTYPTHPPVSPTPLGWAETTTGSHLRYPHLRCQPRLGLATASKAPVAPSGYQQNGAHRGSQRGQRSEEAQTRRYNLWQARRRANRQDYRQWKSQHQDAARKVHGNNSPPPIHLKPTNQDRLQRSLKSAQKTSTVAVINQTRS